MIKAALKTAITAIYPDFATFNHARIMRRSFRKGYATRQKANKMSIYGNANPTVLSGPFMGMKYLDEIVWGPIEPKWLGSYEHELSTVLKDIIGVPCNVIVDIGSAEGYYSVGLAAKKPSTAVFSFDVDPWARRQQARLARLNGVRNVDIRRRCSAADLEQMCAKGRALVICDIEGFEYDLIDPLSAPVLRKTDLLIELHHSYDGAISITEGCRIIHSRFSTTHLINIVCHRPLEKVEQLNFETKMTDSELFDAVNEHRIHDQIWLWCVALT